MVQKNLKKKLQPRAFLSTGSSVSGSGRTNDHMLVFNPKCAEYKGGTVNSAPAQPITVIPSIVLFFLSFCLGYPGTVSCKLACAPVIPFPIVLSNLIRQPYTVTDTYAQPSISRFLRTLILCCVYCLLLHVYLVLSTQST